MARFARILVLLVTAFSGAGCYVELSGGGHLVTGGNERFARLAPSFGVAAGVVYEAHMARVAGGAGGEATITTVDTVRQGVVTGPGHARLDLAWNFWDPSAARAQAGFRSRLAIGGTFGAGSRWYNNSAQTLVAQPYGVFQIYAMPSWSTFFFRNLFTFDIGAGPSVLFTRVDPRTGVPDMFAIGAELKLAIAIPFGPNVMARVVQGIGEGLDAINRPLTPQEQAEYDASLARVRSARSSGIPDNNSALQETDRHNRFVNCLNTQLGRPGGC